MKSILLTQGQTAFVSDTDFEKVNQFSWYAYRDARVGRWYAMRKVRLSNGDWTTQLMHRFIMGLEHGDPRQVDHKNRNATLDNRRENLRVTLDQNQQNVGQRKDNVSGFKGVSFHKQTAKWQARIRVKGKSLCLGFFPTAELAALTYDEAAIQHHAQFAATNVSLGLLPVKKPAASVTLPTAA